MLVKRAGYKRKWLLGMAGTFMTLSLLCAGCGFQGLTGTEKDIVSSQQEEAGLPPGEAQVVRDDSVNYSVPEGVSVLMYHKVGDEKHNGAVISARNFERQMKYLKDHQYHPITMQELHDFVTEGKALPSKPVCITFDDGYEDSYTVVYPIMKKYRFPWTLFLITGMVDQPGRMTWGQLKEMADSHTVTIANHTVSHPHLSQLKSRGEKEKEILNAENTLVEKLGVRSPWIAYPYGDYDKEVLQICKKAGFELGMSMSDGRAHNGSDPFTIRRIWIGNPVDDKHFEDRLIHDNFVKL